MRKINSKSEITAKDFNLPEYEQCGIIFFKEIDGNIEMLYKDDKGKIIQITGGNLTLSKEK